MGSTYAYEIVYYDHREHMKRDVHAVIQANDFKSAVKRASEYTDINGFILEEVRYVGPVI